MNRRGAAFAPALALTMGAAPPADHETVMRDIERIVRMPPAARPLDRYGRNYAPNGPDLVTGIYLVPDLRRPRDEGCEVTGSDFASRPCTAAERRRNTAQDARQVAAQTPAGRHRWFARREDLPFIFDGGCTQVTVLYRPSARQIIDVRCNGMA